MVAFIVAVSAVASPTWIGVTAVSVFNAPPAIV